MASRRLLALLLCLYLGCLSALAQTDLQRYREQGTEAYRAGRYGEAVEAFSAAVKLDPSNLKTWEDLGWAYRKSGDAEAAISTWTRILRIEPSNVELLNALASVYGEQERWPEASETIRKSLELNPSQPAEWLHLGDAYEVLERHNDAVEAFRNAFTIASDSSTNQSSTLLDSEMDLPLHIQAATKLADAYDEAGAGNEARALLKSVSERFPRYAAILQDRLARMLIRSGDQALESGDVNDAENHYKSAKDYGSSLTRDLADKRLASVEWKRGDENYSSTQFDEAIAAYQRAVSLGANNPQLWTNLGWAQFRTGQTDEAIRTWQRALSINSDMLPLLRNLGDAYMELGQPATAAEWYAKAWDSGVHNPQIPFRLAGIAFDAADTGTALRWLDAIIALPDLDPSWGLRIANTFIAYDQLDLGRNFFQQIPKDSQPAALINSGLSQILTRFAGNSYEAGKYVEAIDTYSRALELNPENLLALKNLGWAYWQADQWDECQKAWTRYKELLPGEAEPLGLLARLHLQRGTFDEAIESARASLAVSPDQPLISRVLAESLLRGQKYVEARSLSKTLASQYPDDLPIQRFYGELLMQYEDFVEGKRQWESVAAINPLSGRLLYYWIRSLYETGDYDRALSKAKEAVAAGDAPAQLFRLLVDDALVREDNSTAAQWYEQWLKQYPDVTVGLQLARLYQQMGLLDKSRATLVRLQALSPHDARILDTLAAVERSRGNWNRSQQLDLDLLKRYPSSREAYLGYLNDLVVQRRYADALRLLDKNKSYFLKDYEADTQRATLLAYDRDDSQAADLVRDIVTSQETNARFVPILLYHGIAGHIRSTNLYVERFRSQLKALHGAGYEAITVSDLVMILDGEKSMPRKPIVITFDDARIDSLKRADPVLQEFGMKATMFVPTGKVVDDHPFFADWKMIERYYKTGNWDIQAHGHRAHDPIAVDAAGTPGIFLIDRQWLPETGRIETQQEFAGRVEADYWRNIQVLSERLPDLRVVGYAFPESEAGQLTMGNAPEAADVNQRLTEKYFRFSFIQDSDGYNRIENGDKSPRLLRRFTVPVDWDGAQLLRHLRTKYPPTAVNLEVAKWHYWNGHYRVAHLEFEKATQAEPLLQPQAEYYLGAIASQQGLYKTAAEMLENSLGSSELDAEKRAFLTSLNWFTKPVIANTTRAWFDSTGRSQYSDTISFEIPLRGPVGVSFEGGIVALNSTRRDLSFRGREAGINIQWGTGTWPFAFELGVRHRNMFGGAKDTDNGHVQASYTSLLQTIRWSVSYEDIDTAEAASINLQSRRYSYAHQIRFSTQWDVSLSGSYQSYKDSNIRTDATASIQYHLPQLRALRIGALVGQSDSRFQSSIYYTPENQRMGQVMLGLQRRWETGSFIDFIARGGTSRDRLRGGRIVGSGSLRLQKQWNSRFRNLIDVSYSGAPGYSALSTAISFTFRLD